MLQDFAKWLQDELRSFSLWLLDTILSALAALIDAIPVPDWAQNLGSFPLPSSVHWFADLVALDFGATVVGSALTIRWLYRRLPFVGG